MLIEMDTQKKVSLSLVANNNLMRKLIFVAECRFVLVRYCSGIPRNYNYADGLQLVYEKLREFLGDENLDLSIGVLYELIEINGDYTWDEGSAFRRWQHDHALRAVSRH